MRYSDDIIEEVRMKNDIVDVSSCPADKAVIHLLGWRHGKRRSFLIMEGTQPKIGAPPPCQFHILGYHVYNVIFHSDFFYDVI